MQWERIVRDARALFVINRREQLLIFFLNRSVDGNVPIIFFNEIWSISIVDRLDVAHSNNCL